MNTAPIQAELSALCELVVTLKQALELSRQENVLLRQKIDSLVRRVFGSSSERLDRAQLELLLQLPALVETSALLLQRWKHPKSVPKRKRWPSVGIGRRDCRRTCRWWKK
jgi:Transposase C of IS166 homeodomain